MTARQRRGWSTGGIIRAILASQLAIGAFLVARDVSLGVDGTWPDFRPDTPRLETPVRPGDQTRRYRLPRDPGSSPIPTRRDMPDRLTVEGRQDDGSLRLAGQIAGGDAERIIAALEREAPSRVSLNSPGGSVYDALEIGRALRDAGIETEVRAGAICLSACPYIFVGGTMRSADADAMIGVHQHYFGQSTVLPAFMAVEDVQRGQAEVMAYLDDMGIDPLVMRHALETPPDEIYLLVEEELRRYRVTTTEDE